MSAQKQLLRQVSVALDSEPEITPELIREKIAIIRSAGLVPDSTDDDAESVARQIESYRHVTIRLGSVVSQQGHRPWVATSRGALEWFYWERYEDLLGVDQGWPRDVVAVMNRDTDRILDHLADPRSDGPWDRRGMVIGHVQSGKTANYIGLIAKAADAGYRIIIVIAGIHEVLRSQTQARIDEAFLGWDTGRGLERPGEAVIGVGRRYGDRRPGSFTSSKGDFSLAVARGVHIPLNNLREPVVFVVKKNYRTLQNLIDFLETHGKVDQPCLVIDDEADNASINIEYLKDEVSKINGLIRKMLVMYPRSSYVAYTATPFANVFIDPDTDDEMLGSDLFPEHFIYALDAPSNYFGADGVFGDIDSDVPQVLRFIDDHQDLIPAKHKKDLEISDLPPSMVEAVHAFIVSCAIREFRGQGDAHMSMLVNVSVYRDVQRRVANRLFDEIKLVRDALRLNAGLGPSEALQNSRVRALHEAWQREYASLCSWPDLFDSLLDSAMRLDVVEVNSKSNESLAYEDHEDGRRVIAVGGYSLSRGLTLEGLTVSYFLRNSRMYDTLMQMARWFGYRPGYEDLCRVWITETAAGWYAHIAESIRELREEVSMMRGGTPRDFGLKVRAHPDALLIATSKTKMGSAEERVLQLDLARKFIETPLLKADRSVLDSNTEIVGRLVTELGAAGRSLSQAERWPHEDAGYLVKNVNWQPVVRFLQDFDFPDRRGLMGPDLLLQYIRARTEEDLATWDVLFAGVGAGPGRAEPDSRFVGVPLRWQTRTAGDSLGDVFLLNSRYRVGSPGDERAGIDPRRVSDAEETYRKDNPKAKTVPGSVYRAIRERPLLVVHLLRMKDAPSALGDLSNDPVAAFSISFPSTEVPGEQVSYLVNETWRRQQLESFEPEEELLDED